MATTKDGNHVLCPEWDTADSHGNLEHIRQTVLKKCGCVKSKCITCRKWLLLYELMHLSGV